MDLGLSWIEWLWFPQGAHLILLTVVILYVSPGPSASVLHLGLHGHSDSGPHSGIIGTWILSYIPGPHLELVTVVPPGPHLDEVTGSHRDLPWAW